MHHASHPETFLTEESILENREELAIKRVIACQIVEMMQQQKITKTEMARRMNTSRAVIDRLIDPRNTSLTLITLVQAVKALGGQIKLEFELDSSKNLSRT